MARKRPSSQKREREYQKRQRELRKAEKAAQKRERRFNRSDSESPPPQEDVDGPTGEDKDGAT